MKFPELLDEYKIPYRNSGHEHCRPGWIQIDCPFCTPDSNHFRCGYNINGKYLNCWSCGRLNLVETLALILRKTNREVWVLLKDIEGGVRVQPKERGGNLILPNGLVALQDCHKTYLRRRGFKWRELVKLWEIKGIGLSDAGLSWRLFLPIHRHGQIVSWTTRSTSDSHPNRYISAGAKQEVIDHKELLYGEDYVRHSVVVVEGPLDVWAIGPGAVGTFGTSFSRGQVEKISRYPKRAICFDADAQHRAKELSDLLAPFPGDTYIITLDAKDPGEAKQSEINQIRKHFLEA